MNKVALLENGKIPGSGAASRMRPERRRRFLRAGGTIILVIWIITVLLWVKRLNTEPSSAKMPAPGVSAALSSPQTEWMEIYLKKDKIGYSERHVSPVGGGYLAREEMLLRLNLMGRVTSLKVLTQATLGADYTLRGFHFLMTSGAVRFTAKGNIEPEGIRVRIGEGKNSRDTLIPVSGPVTISAGLPGYLKGLGLELGRSLSFLIFDPSIMAQREVSVLVAAKEDLEIRGIRYSTLRLEGDFFGQKMNFWLDKDGGVLKEEGAMGLTLIRASEAAALGDMASAGGEDLYRLASVPVGKKLWKPERLVFLKLRAGGLESISEEMAAPDTGRQSLQGDTLLIEKEKVPEHDAYQAPYQAHDMREFLRPEFGVESDHPSIVKAARDIAGGLRSPLSISRKIMDWVYGYIEKMPVMSVPRALDVLEKKVGDCNEHAALAAALLRAAGIPARICVGLVYKDDAFYYHAWNEVYLGSWISMDAVANQMPADPTHIRLAQGGLDKQTSILGLIGKIRLEILDYGYD